VIPLVVRESAVAWIGWSHLLQPPMTFWLATRVLRLREAFDSLPFLARRIAKIMGVTAVSLPTVIGVLLAQCPAETLHPGPLRAVAFIMAGCLWTPRLAAQILFVGPAFPTTRRTAHWALVVIFIVQGPVFLALLL
jgi:hypothetical protein